MARRVELTGNNNRRIVLEDTVTRRVSPSEVGERLGAEPLDAVSVTRSRRSLAEQKAEISMALPLYRLRSGAFVRRRARTGQESEGSS